MSAIRRLIVVAAAIVAATSAVLADNLVGRLDHSDRAASDGRYYDMYPFEGRAGQSLDLSVISPDFVPFVILYRPDQQPAANKTGAPMPKGGNLDSSFPLDADRTWYLLVSQTAVAEGTYVMEMAAH